MEEAACPLVVVPAKAPGTWLAHGTAAHVRTAQMNVQSMFFNGVQIPLAPHQQLVPFRPQPLRPPPRPEQPRVLPSFADLWMPRVGACTGMVVWW